jgi:hypothetical protein
MDKQAVEDAVVALIEQITQTAGGATSDRVTITHSIRGRDRHHYRVNVYTVNGSQTHHFDRNGRKP